MIAMVWYDIVCHRYSQQYNTPTTTSPQYNYNSRPQNYYHHHNNKYYHYYYYHHRRLVCGSGLHTRQGYLLVECGL